VKSLNEAYDAVSRMNEEL
jgi:hypothetical protein